MEVPIPNFYFMGIQFIHLFALATWVGGIVIIGAIVAPTLFKKIKPRSQAGELMGQILSKFDKVALCCSGALIGTGIIKFFTWENLTPWNATRYLAIMVMSGVCLYSVFVVSPRLRTLISQRQADGKPVENEASGTRPESEMPRSEFSKLHLNSVRLMMVNLVCGTVALLMA
jgi:putative copper export protein